MSDPAEGPSRGTGRRRRSRRRLLESGVAAASLGLAGCLGVLSGDGGDGTGNESENATPPAGGNGTDAEPGPAPTVDAWPQFQYDAGNSGNPPGSGPTGELEVDWRFERGEAFWGGPVISEDGTVVCGCDDGKLYAVDLANGSLGWVNEMPGRVRASPAIYDNLAIVSHGEALAAFDLDTGKQQWDNREVTGGLTPKLSGDRIVVPSSDDFLYGVDAATGAPLWEYEVGSVIDRPPAIGDDTAYVADTSNEVYAVTLDDGSHRYEVAIGEEQVTGPTVSDAVIYIGGAEGNVYALDAENHGNVLWNTELVGDLRPNIAVGDGSLFVTDTVTRMHCLGLVNGEQRWSKVISEGWSWSDPVLLSDSLLIGGARGDLHRRDALTGTPTEVYNIGEYTLHNVSVQNSSVVCGAQTELVCLRP